MAVGLVSKKYLIDCANAIRAMLNSESTYTLSQMAIAIGNIDGSIEGSITKSTNTDTGVVTDSLLDGICDALRTKKNDNTLTFTPAQIADAILSLYSGGGGGGSVDIVSFASGTDQQIAALIDAAHSGDIDLQQDAGWAVGDTRTISISAFTGGGNVAHAAQNIDIVISSFDEYMSCGNVMQFDFLESLATKNRMNSTDTNSGGYGSSEMKTTTLPALVNALPTWLKERLIEFSVLGHTGGTTETITNNKLALRSEIEMIGSVHYSYSGEGVQVQYNTTQSNRIKKIGISGTASDRSWQRSPSYNTSNKYTCIGKNGGYDDGYGASNTKGVAPFGCL